MHAGYSGLAYYIQGIAMKDRGFVFVTACEGISVNTVLNLTSI